ncbi:MAG TPA: glucosaminidase domain-containing protein [Flavobacterium sp.]|nr:glucosaminidase domain-containing protein [Flavobacterium sp.]
MKKLIGLFVVILLASCGASRNTKTKQKIREHYPKTVQKTEYPNKEISSVAEIKPEIKEETETLEATSKVNVSRNSVEEYIDKYKSLAIENMREYKIPASIKMAQAILESGSGNGKLAREAHNHFGIKCKSSWTGKSVRHTDDAPDECFRMYDSVEDSFKDHSEFLAYRPYYKKLFTLNPSDYAGWAKGLKQAGYATDPKYADKLISIIERYELYKLDQEALGSDYKKAAIPTTNSKIDYYTVQKGDTLYRISQQYSTSVDEIKRLNHLSDNTISIGQTLRVQ